MIVELMDASVMPNTSVLKRVMEEKKRSGGIKASCSVGNVLQLDDGKGSNLM